MPLKNSVVFRYETKAKTIVTYLKSRATDYYYLCGMEVLIFIIIVAIILAGMSSRFYMRNTRNLSWYADYDKGIAGKILRWLLRKF